MAKAKESAKDERTVQERNFDQGRETARINHENDVKQNSVDGNEGVEVREAKPVEVINPVLNAATGELEDDTRTLKQTPEEQVGAVEDKSADRASDDK